MELVFINRAHRTTAQSYFISERIFNPNSMMHMK